MTRRGSTLILVIWTLAITTVMVVSLQVTTFRAAMAGREAMGTVRARWAARAGVENVIAYLTWDALQGGDVDLQQFQSDLQEISADSLDSGAEFLVEHWNGEETVPGPADVHAKINVNMMDSPMLQKLEYMTEDLANSILDWADGGDEERPGGGEKSSYYSRQTGRFAPRNSLIRCLQEIEAVKGVDPWLLREEDWNLNGLLDPNERDGELSWPDDNGDDLLDAGWSACLTTLSRAAKTGPSGEDKIDLRAAEIADIRKRLDVDERQAQTLQDWAKQDGSRLVDLLTRTLQQISQNSAGGAEEGAGATVTLRFQVTRDSLGTNNQGQDQNRGDNRQNQGGNQGQNQSGNPTQGGGQGSAGATGQVRNLTLAQLTTVLAEASIGPVLPLEPGLVNINTAPREVLELLPRMDEEMLDELESYREGNPEGLSSVLDVQRVLRTNRDTLAVLAGYIDVRSQVFQVTSRGRALPAMTQVELVVTIDRSRLPVTIIEYLER